MQEVVATLAYAAGFSKSLRREGGAVSPFLLGRTCLLPLPGWS
jgi:hypothetical protein